MDWRCSMCRLGIGRSVPVLDKLEESFGCVGSRRGEESRRVKYGFVVVRDKAWGVGEVFRRHVVELEEVRVGIGERGVIEDVGGWEGVGDFPVISPAWGI